MPQQTQKDGNGNLKSQLLYFKGEQLDSVIL
jgi:hypothetical protein